MAPIVHRLEQRYAGKIKFVYLDIDDPAVKQIMREMEIFGHPYFVLLDAQGEIVDEWYGVVTETQLTRAFDAMLAAQSGQ